MANSLSFIQLEALEHVKNKSKKLNDESQLVINNILNKHQIDLSIFEKVIKNIQVNAKVTIHFHPDRLNKSGITVAELLLKEGIYQNQFETGLSNGGLTAFRGGQRDIWEKGLFGGVYQQIDTNISERPKYGALDLMNFADGAAPRFGSCYFKLKSDVSKRCSFTNRDSVYEPEVFGTIDNFVNILSSLLEEIENKDEVLGLKGFTISSFIDQLLNISNNKINYSANYGRRLDDYIEAQIHGSVDIKDDVETLVADPSFQLTETGETLKLICEKYNINLDWHAGFKIHTSQIPDEFRGPKIPFLAKKIAGDNFINTSMLGETAKSLFYNPEKWSDCGTYDETLQQIKQLWHVLAYYGQPLKTLC